MSSSSDGSCVIGIGEIVAIVLSWGTHHSVAWAILHIMCGWLYVIYWLIVYA